MKEREGRAAVYYISTHRQLCYLILDMPAAYVGKPEVHCEVGATTLAIAGTSSIAARQSLGGILNV